MDGHQNDNIQERESKEREPETDIKHEEDEQVDCLTDDEEENPRNFEDDMDLDYVPNERLTPSPTMDDDSQFYEGNGEGGDASNQYSVPLIPTEFTSIDEAMQNFTVVFESRYGAMHPQFCDVTLQETLTFAFEMEIMERKPLVLYLHNDKSVAAHIFAQTVLCSDSISHLLQKQFVTWAWDMTQLDNRNKFYGWLSAANMHEVATQIRPISNDRYPLLVVLIKERGKITSATMALSHDDVTSVIGKLVNGLDMYHEIRTRDQEEEKGRIERELFRQEQVEEYERSKAMDEEKRIKREQEAIEVKRKEDNERAKKDELEQRRQLIRDSLHVEPKANGGNGKNGTVRIRINFPNGEKDERVFNATDDLEQLFNAVFVHKSCPDDFTLFAGYPRRELCLPSWYQEFTGRSDKSKAAESTTFKEEGFTSADNVMVQNNDA